MQLEEFDPTREIHLTCSSCAAPLVDIIKRDDTISGKLSKLIANCPHCGDKSYVKTISGDFFIGHTDYTEYTGFQWDKIEYAPDNKTMRLCEVTVQTKKRKSFK